ncbi:M16 family metallopeptidase [Roseivirga thermotolerans]|uniref:M16 family metallopeptidase n=1 Tax=Roseivirga thermotolerans TaxID=1758176 RepID=UPI00273D2E4B|nr:pitrilysin family protein [Roseivirga thermotolerans]
MKRLFTLALMCLSLAVTAQIDRTKLPEPAPAREIEIGDYEKFKLKNGLTVIVVENDKLPTLSWTLTFDAGVITEGDKAGYTGIFGQVMEAGTKSKSKEELNEEIDFMGASFNVGATSMSAFSLSKYKEDILKIFTDVLYNPAFPEDEFERAIEQTLTSLKQAQDSPDAIASNIEGVVNYGKDHPFGELTTEETVNNIELQDLKNHYARYFKPNIAYLIVVGDIKKSEAQKLVKKYFENWKQGKVEKEAFEQPKPVTQTSIAFVDRPSSVQSVINISYPIDNKPGSEDAVKLSLLNQILGGGGLSTRLNMNLREDKGYTYGAYSSIGSSRYSATFNASASVRNEVTDSALNQFIYELNKIASELVTDEELELAKNSAKGSFARSLESRGTVANFALSAELNNLPDDYYATYLKRVDAVTKEDILEVAKRYIRPDKANIIVVGKAEEVAEKLKPFGPITYYDAFGNIVDDPTKVVIDANVSVESVLANYVKAIGGKAALDKVETLEYKANATLSMGGQSMDITRTVYQKAPDKFVDVTAAPMMGEQKQIYNSGEGKIVVGGQTMPVTGLQLGALKYSAILFAERFYDKIGFEAEYKGVKKVEGKDAHRIDVSVDGFTVIEYYDTTSGLKIQTDMGAQGGTVSYTDYTSYEGIMLPKKIIVKSPQLPVALEFVTQEVKINKGIDDSRFN